MRELDDVFNEGIAARESSLRGTAPALLGDQVARLVRRRRGRRYALQGVAVVAAGALLGTAGWWGLSRQAPTPALTPAPTTSSPATPEPSATPTPATPSATPTAAPTPTPIVEPGLPAALPAPDGLLDRMGPGWLLSLYYSAPAAGDGSGAKQVVFASAPDGTLYRLLDLPPEQQFRLVDWRVGAPRARVLAGAWSQGRDGGGVGWLDLRTGAYTTDDPQTDATGQLSFVGSLPDGTELWQTVKPFDPNELYAVPAGGRARLVGNLGSGSLLTQVNPSGTMVVASKSDGHLVVLRVSDRHREDIELSAASDQCDAVGWIDDVSVLVLCRESDPNATALLTDLNPRLIRVNVDTSSVTELTSLKAGDPFPRYITPGTSAHGVVFPAATIFDGEQASAFYSDDLCLGDSVWRWSPGGMQPLWTTTPAACVSLFGAIGADRAGEYVFFDVRTPVGDPWTGPARFEVYGVGPDGHARVVVPAPVDPGTGELDPSWVVDNSWIPVG